MVADKTRRSAFIEQNLGLVHSCAGRFLSLIHISPAHDPNDFEVGLRHELPIVSVFTYDGHMTGAADKAAADALFAAGKNTVNEPHVLDCGKYAGMTTLEARKAILADLEAGGFLKETEPLKHEVGTCYRCHSTIEVSMCDGLNFIISAVPTQRPTRNASM